MLDLIRLKHLEDIRYHEINEVLNCLPKSAIILEIGAGRGWQSRLLSEHGYEVFAIDLQHGKEKNNLVFPVIEYDGVHIPFRDGSFDIIFSSNVLEHVKHIKEIQNELARVLRPEGFAIHVVPTSAWRFWTIITYHIYIVRLIGQSLSRNLQKPNNRMPATSSSDVASIWKRWYLALWPSRHGEQGNALSEIYFFSKSRWKEMFETTGWHIEISRPIGLFYTGNQILEYKISMSARQWLANFFGSATMIFKVRQSGK